VALVPPKPKVRHHDVDLRVVDALAHDRHVGERDRDSSMLALSQMKPFLHHQDRIDRLLGAGRAERMAGQRLGRRIGGMSSPKTVRIASISFWSPTGVEVPCGLM
jgi:hypothetical protein